MKKEKYHRDHIWSQIEGGPNADWNLRSIPASENLRKGPRMPNLNEVSESPNPLKLAVEIDKHSLTKGFKHPRNKNKGFGGLPRY